MKYLKFFEAVDTEEFDYEKMAEHIYQFYEEFPDSPSVNSISEHVGGPGSPINKIKNDIIRCIDSYSGRDLAKFLKAYDYILAIGNFDVSLEEVEDLFLDLQYKYTIQKAHQSELLINIEILKVPHSEIPKLSSHIWGTINQRLDENLFIRALSIQNMASKENIYIVYIEIIRKSNKHVDYDEDYDDGDFFPANLRTQP